MESFSLVSIYLGSMLLGLSVAAPIGPINVEIIRRGLTQSARSAFALGCGAVTADCCYFALALAGAAMVSRLGESGSARVAGLAIGGTMLGWLGVSAMRRAGSIAAATPAMAGTAAAGSDAIRASGAGVSMLRTWMLGLGLTLANPMTIALWLSIAAGFASSAGAESARGIEAPVLRLAGVFSGALSWVCFVTSLTAWARRWINPAMMRAVNLISGVILVGYGAWFFASMLMPA